MNAATLKAERAGGKHAASRNGAEGVSPVKRDEVLRAAGRQRAAIPLKAQRVAAVVGIERSVESRIRSGRRNSPLGAASLAVYESATKEARPLEATGAPGVTGAYVEIILRTIAMLPELEKLSTADLYAELRKEIVRVETRANSLCNDLEADFLLTGALPADRLHGLLDGHTQQGASSARISAILQILAERQD
jgi:hypothetical protein